MEEASPWIVYLIRCRGDRLYCGVTPDLAARWAAHVAGRGAKFTRAFPPLALVGATRVAGRSEALSLEARIKRQCRAAKLAALQSAGSPLDDAALAAFTA